MGGEPWCKLPAEIADLTDYQILHLYYYPAVERAKDQQPPRAAGDPSPDQLLAEHAANPPRQMAHPPIGTPAFRDWFIRTTAPFWGVERAKREYEAQLKEYQEAPADAWWRKPP